MSEKIKKLLKILDEETKNQDSPADRALFCLLKRYEDKLPEPDDYFHKAFRQTDVTDSGYTDMAIWHLLSASGIFWNCFERVQDEKPLTP